MPKLFIIDDTWTHQQWVSTGGTRAKKFLLSPDGDFYYFKRSQVKPGKDFTYEFWSEIIASELGRLLGFNILTYDLAIYDEWAGCISKSMIASTSEELIEVVKYLQAFSPKYNPALKEHQIWYTFQMIEHALEMIKKKAEMKHVVSVIILDALIGNSDRHQENMAFISTQLMNPDLQQYLDGLDRNETDSKLKRWISAALKKIKERGEPLPKAFYKTSVAFSPIYDSGCSLGRELTDERLQLYLKDEKAFEAYINRGKSEIHWQDGRKYTHFDLLRLILQTSYAEGVKTWLKRIQSRWDNELVESIVMNVDKELPETHARFRIPPQRKQFILKLLTSRFKKLEELLHA